jgi:hypothetical protein
MNKIFTLLGSIGFAGTILAQPTITTDILPVFDDHVIIGICDEPTADYAAVGEGITWDLSSLVESEEGFFDFTNPEGTFWGYLYPEATICGVSHDNAYTYYKDDNSKLETVGFGFIVDELDPPNDTVTSAFTNFELVLEMPFDFGDTHSDNWAGVNEALGFSQNFTGTTDAEYDAHGDLVLPNGTYSNVARYHADRVQVSGAVTQTKEQWIWMSPDYRFWLLLIETIETTGGTDEVIVWYNKNPIPTATNVAELAQQAVLAVFPNPLASGAPVTISSDSREAGLLNIYDLSGKLLEQKRLQLEMGQNEVFFDQTITSGVYFLVFQGERQLKTARVIINQ